MTRWAPGALTVLVAVMLCTGGPDVIKNEAWSFYRTISGVRLCWELEEPYGPKGRATHSEVVLRGRCVWNVLHVYGVPASGGISWTTGAPRS